MGLFDRARRAGAHATAEEREPTPPEQPTVMDRMRGAAMWAQLYAHDGPQPPLAVLMWDLAAERRVLTYLDQPNTGVVLANVEVLGTPVFKRQFMDPLIHQLVSDYSADAALILTHDGRVLAASREHALEALRTGTVPGERSAGTLIRVSPQVMRVWDAAGAYVTGAASNSVIGWIGVVLFFFFAYATGVSLYLWWVLSVGPLADALGEWPLTAAIPPSGRIGISIFASVLEVAGMLMMAVPVMAGMGVFVAFLDGTVFVAHGWRMGATQSCQQAVCVPGEQDLNAAFGAIGAAIIALGMEFLILIFLALTIRLAPLLVWALYELRTGWMVISVVRVRGQQRIEQARQRILGSGYEQVMVYDQATGRYRTEWQVRAELPQDQR